MVMAGLVQSSICAAIILLEAHKSCIIWMKCRHSKMNLEANVDVFLGTGGWRECCDQVSKNPNHLVL